MARHKVDVRREEILVATIKEIEASGMASLRVADVASTLGVSSGLVFYHFDTKDALLVAALEFAVQRDLEVLDDNLTRGGTATERLRRVIASYGPSGKAQGWTLWIDAWTVAQREPTVRQAMRRLDARWRSAVEAAVVDGVARGEFRCTDPATAVGKVGAAIDGFAVSAVVYGSISQLQMRAWIRDAFASELGVDPDSLS